LEPVQLDVVLHELFHLKLVCDVQRRFDLAAFCNSKADQSSSCTEFQSVEMVSYPVL